MLTHKHQMYLIYIYIYIYIGSYFYRHLENLNVFLLLSKFNITSLLAVHEILVLNIYWQSELGYKSSHKIS